MSTPSLWDLVDQLEDSDEDKRRKAADEIAKRGTAAKGAVPKLSEALRDRSPAVREHAAKALAAIGVGAKAAVPSLVEALKDTEFEVRMAAVQAIGGIGAEAKSAIPALAEVAKSDKWFGCQCEAVETLVQMGADPSVTLPILMRCLDDKCIGTPATIATATGLLGKDAKDAVPLLKNRMEDPRSPSMQAAAKQARERILDACVE